MSVPAMIETSSPGMLPAQYWERFWAGCHFPVTIRPASMPDEHRLLRKYLPPAGGKTTLAEIGCAPGKWLHYFQSQFGYRVTGIDYAPQACEATRRNLQSLGTDATILNADVFDYVPPDGGFDVVASFGLIEHFRDLTSIVHRIIGFVKPGGLILSMVPNLYGPEGWVLRTVRPKVYAGHVPIRLGQFRQLHESAGTETLFAHYAGGCCVTAPLRGTEFARWHPRLALLLNLPALGLNRAIRSVEVASGVYPRLWFASPKLIYVGRRTAC